LFWAVCTLLGRGLCLPTDADVVAVDNPGIYLSINSLAYTEEDGTVVKRRLEVTWFGHKEIEESEKIILSQDSEVLLELIPRDYPDGFYTTDIQVAHPTVESLKVPSCVFNYSVSWTDAMGSTLASACLRNEPEWQWSNKEKLSKMKVGSMMLTGGHDAGAYRDYHDQGDDNLATSAVYAQEEDLLNQLLWGVRFLDIRVGYYHTLEEKFWLVHGIIKTHPMSEGLEQVKEFLRSSRDVIVFEINGFEQPWTQEAHELWKELLLIEFSRWLVTPGDLGWETTLQDIWNREGLPEDEGRIIITYNDGHTDPTLFYPEVSEHWGNVDEPEKLREYLQREVGLAENNPAYQPWKPNCQMTPTTEDIIGGRWSGLREMADAVNRNVTSWWRDEWTELTSTFSIHDYVLSTDMIKESIRRCLRIAENLN